MWDEARLRQRAGDQHGLLTRTELLSLGATPDEIRHKLGSRRLEVRHPGIYYLDSIPPTWKTTVLAAVLGAGPDALASHRCAAVLWEMDGIYGRVVELTVPYAESPEPDGAIVHRTRRLNPTAVADSIPVTNAERTIFDLASMLPQRVVEKAARSAVHRGLTTPEKLDIAVGTFGGRGVTGTKKMRRIVQVVADDESGSVAEIDLKYVIWDAPVPTPIQQFQIRLPGDSNAYPDFSWPDRMRIVEVDGFGAHGTPELLQNDLRRQNSLMELGWEIRRFTATEIRDEPGRVRDELTRFVNSDRSVKI
jgi:hypothetical protein